METYIAFVLNYIKYGESAAIIHFYTKENGLITGISKGAFSAKNKTIRNALLPLSQVELTLNHKGKSELKTIRNIQLNQPYYSLHSNPQKIAITQFLAEILHLTLKEQEPNTRLFNFIENQMNLFDVKSSEFADFHLIFLFQLTHYLGFYPNLENEDLRKGLFNLQEGAIIDQKEFLPLTLNSEQNKWWLQLANIRFSESYKNQFNQKQRQVLLQILLQYYEIHHSEFRQPKSLEILSALF